MSSDARGPKDDRPEFGLRAAGTGRATRRRMACLYRGRAGCDEQRVPRLVAAEYGLLGAASRHYLHRGCPLAVHERRRYGEQGTITRREADTASRSIGQVFDNIRWNWRSSTGCLRPEAIESNRRSPPNCLQVV